MESGSIPLHVSQLLERLLMSSENELRFRKNDLLTLVTTQVQLLGRFDFRSLYYGYSIGIQLVVHGSSTPNGLISFCSQGSTLRRETHRAVDSVALVWPVIKYLHGRSKTQKCESPQYSGLSELQAFYRAQDHSHSIVAGGLLDTS